MKYVRTLFILLLIFTSHIFAIVGDWVSYGSQLTLSDLHIKSNNIYAASHGGIVEFDIVNEQFLKQSNYDQLEHIDISHFYSNADNSEWFTYGSGLNGISYIGSNGQHNYFDFDFQDANAITGNSEHVLLSYMNGLNPEIAHFVKHNNQYIFQDVYNQFPSQPESINDMVLLGDSIYLASDAGLIKANLYHPNLKPENAWELLPSVAHKKLFVYGDSLIIVTDDGVYSYFEGQDAVLYASQAEPICFYGDPENLLYASEHQIVDLLDSNSIYNTDNIITGMTLHRDTLWIAEKGYGLKRVPMGETNGPIYIPNTFLDLTARSLAITADQKVAICGLEGIAILDKGSWHNLVFSPFQESLGHQIISDAFSADTLNISYHDGEGRLVVDALVSSQNKLYCTITHVSVKPVSGQSPNAQGPGVMQEIDLNDFSSYTVYDTSDQVFVGTQGIGSGSDWYLLMGGLAEDKYNNIFALNLHTLAAETLVKFQENGQIRKYSEEESDNTLQVLAREMVFDRYGRLWIANQAHQEDVPRTLGGITVFDQSTGEWNLITTSDGLASNDVYSLDVDPITGNMWVATAAGVQMIYVPSTFNSATEFSMIPQINGLSGMVPVKLRVDTKGNKWILTQSQGVQIYMSNNRWYNDGAGLSTENSDLLDNIVYDIVFDSKQGYAYLLTASGLSRFEIAWTDERENMDDVIVFPQPFHPGVDPYIAFDGLAEQSQLKITTIDGRVIKQFNAESDENFEKQIVWDGKLSNGTYISRGVYLVFISNIDGIKKTLKFAVE